MKKLAYALYVITILLISGLARANAATVFDVSPLDNSPALYQSPVVIQQARADLATLQLTIAGSVPNPCFGSPSAMLTQDSANPSILILHVSAPVPLNACISRVKYFQTTVSLPILAQTSLINLADKALYTIKLEGFQLELPISGSDLKR